MAKTPEIDVRDSFRNYLINADMRISQRGTSFTSVGTATYTLDRYQYFKNGAMVHNVTQDADAPTVAQAGYLFTNSLRITLTTPDTSIAAGEYASINQIVEGYNWANLAQKAFSLSFWVKATTPGIYCVSLRNAGQNRSYIAEYTINTSNTWEFKTIRISASPSVGTWNYTNGAGLAVAWVLASGTTFQTPADSWTTGNFLASANQVNGTNTGSTDFWLTGVMLCEQNAAADIGFRSFSNGNFADEFMACQRYYRTSYEFGTTPGTAGTPGRVNTTSTDGGNTLPGLQFGTVMRSAPTVVLYNQGTGGSGKVRRYTGSVDTAASATTTSTTGINDISGTFATNAQYDYHYTAEAEL